MVMTMQFDGGLTLCMRKAYYGMMCNGGRKKGTAMAVHFWIGDKSAEDNELYYPAVMKVISVSSLNLRPKRNLPNIFAATVIRVERMQWKA